MKFSLDLQLVHIDQTKIQQVLAQLPALTDVTVWSEQYEVSAIGRNMGGTAYQASAMVRFHQDADREAVNQAIQNIQGVLFGFEVGTRIQKHRCFHDGPAKPCEIEIIYEVVP